MSFLNRLKSRVIRNPQPLVPWDRHDIDACLTRPYDACEAYLQDDDDEVAACERIVKDLLSPNKRPSDGDPFLCVVTFGPDQLLTFVGDAKTKPYVPLFSSPLRGMHYSRVALGDSPEPVPMGYAFDDCPELGRALLRQHAEHFVLDRCPHCSVIEYFDMKHLTNQGDILQIWAIRTAVRLQRYDKLVGIAKDKLGGGEATEAREMAEHIVTHVDAERPEVHLLLGECGIHQRDKELLERKLKLLAGFGPHWVVSLQRLLDEYNGTAAN